MKYANLIDSRISFLQKILTKKKAGLKHLPEGFIRTTRNKHTHQYYLVESKNPWREKYLSVKEKPLIRKYLQREYDEKLIKAIELELKLLKRLQRFYPKHMPEQVYSKMPRGKQLLIEPMVETDEQYLERIFREPYIPLSVEGDDTYKTLNGEIVRSKSEQMIADKLFLYNIPYMYERPLTLNGFGKVYPDFTLIDVKQRRLIFLEHLGLMDDKEYMNRNIKKLRAYESHGYFLGESVLLSFETFDTHVDDFHILNVVKHFIEVDDQVKEALKNVKKKFAEEKRVKAAKADAIKKAKEKELKQQKLMQSKKQKKKN